MRRRLSSLAVTYSRYSGSSSHFTSFLPVVSGQGT